MGSSRASRRYVRGASLVTRMRDSQDHFSARSARNPKTVGLLKSGYFADITISTSDHHRPCRLHEADQLSEGIDLHNRKWASRMRHGKLTGAAAGRVLRGPRLAAVNELRLA